MAAASFFTLFYWAVFGAVALYLLWLVHVEMDRRSRVRRMRELRMRRARLDAVEPKPWTYREPS